MPSTQTLRLEQFHFYSKEAGTRRTRRDLPHWEQRCVCTFVTFRMVDSLPQEIIAGWVAERDAWLLGHGLDPADEHWRAALEELPEEMVDEFHRTFTRRMHEFLDAGYGSCLLRRADLRRVVEDSFLHWHGQRCLLAGFVIMPNHAHLLVQPMPDHSLLEVEKCRLSPDDCKAAPESRATGLRGGGLKPNWPGSPWPATPRRP